MFIAHACRREAEETEGPEESRTKERKEDRKEGRIAGKETEG